MVTGFVRGRGGSQARASIRLPFVLEGGGASGRGRPPPMMSPEGPAPGHAHSLVGQMADALWNATTTAALGTTTAALGTTATALGTTAAALGTTAAGTFESELRLLLHRASRLLAQCDGMVARVHRFVDQANETERYVHAIIAPLATTAVTLSADVVKLVRDAEATVLLPLGHGILEARRLIAQLTLYAHLLCIIVIVTASMTTCCLVVAVARCRYQGRVTTRSISRCARRGT